MSQIITKQNRGFTLLYASLVSALLLAIGLAVFNIGSKELLLSSSARESQFAFYSADTGIECALYWDFVGSNTFATSSASNPPSSGINCAARDIATSWDYSNRTSTAATTTFELNLSNIGGADRCVAVTVGKSASPNKTNVEARGYNTSCNSTSPRRVERALRVSY